MRFVRAFTNMENGALEHVWEQELPFADDAPNVHTLEPLPDGSHKRHDFDMHELGLAEHFDPTHAITGALCSPAAHLFQRLESVPPAQRAAGTGLKRFRAKPGHQSAIPVFHEVPTTVAGILTKLRAGGPAAVHERVGHWLHFLGVLNDDEMKAAGLPFMTLSVALEFDAMRLKRDPSVGSRAELFKRAVKQRAADRLARSIHKGG